jgi:hypothetical protein
MELVRKLSQVAVFVLLLAACLWPAIYNGAPLLYSDTSAYVRYADVAVAKFTHHSPRWWARQREQSDPTASGQSHGDSEKTPFMGRSIYYGMLLRLGDAYGMMMWPSIVLQAAALLLAIVLTLTNAGFDRLAVCVSVPLLAVATPVAFFASRLMPDMFAGVAILAVASLIVYGDRMARTLLLAWVGLLAAALLFHSTHVLTALALAAIYLLGRLFFQIRVSWLGLGAVALCILVAFAGDAAFSIATRMAYGATPIRPPFMTARVIADGPGEAYLRSNCPQSGFVVCDFIDRFPTTADHFLWSSDTTQGGVFVPADPSTRRALSAEQFRFVLAVLRYDPLGEIVSVGRDTWKQLSLISVSDFNYDDIDKQEFRQELPLDHLKVAEGTRAWTGTMPVSLISAVVMFVFIVSIAYVVWAVVRTTKSDLDHQLRQLAIAVVIGVVVNGFICGAMSDQIARYQSRVIWVITLMAGLMYGQRSPWFRRSSFQMATLLPSRR